MPNLSSMKIIFFLFTFLFSLAAPAKVLNIVAAENFYAGIAAQLGGPYVQVTSILNNPNQDPHLFSASPTVAKKIADAEIVIYNGAAYDPWMDRLLAANQKKISTIIVATLMDKKIGANPHLWYDPKTMPIYAKTLTKILIVYDPQHQNYYAQQLEHFLIDYQKLSKKIAELKQRYQNTPVIATEPVFGYMSDALGFKMHGIDFQLSEMNGIAPSSSQTRAFENNLRLHQVRILLYNNQVVNPVTHRMQLIAEEVKIPIVGVSEMQPLGATYVDWMLKQLDDLEQALKTSYLHTEKAQ